MKKNYFSRKIRQFRNLSSTINRLMVSHEWERLGHSYRNYLIARLNRLFRQLSQFLSKPELVKLLAGAAIFIGIPLASQSQSFAPPQLNPFGLTPDSVYISKPAFADIDNDSDLDLFAGIYQYDSLTSIQFYKNIGTPDAPLFDPAQKNPFGIDIPFGMVAFPAFADLDNDGDADLLLGVSIQDNYIPQFLYYQNTGSVTEPQFAAPQLNPFGISGGLGFAIPDFADIDHDGDLDLFTGEIYGNIKFYENTGSAAAPAFAPPQQNPFGITPAYYLASPAFSDIDHDGDLDLFVGEYYGNFQYFRNSGTMEEPAFASAMENPFGLVPTYDFNFPAIADLDDDGDDDIMAGEYYGMFQYFKNTEINTGTNEILNEAGLKIYPNPASNEVFIDFADLNPGQSIELAIIDLNGRIVKSEIIKTGDRRLATDDLVPGIYFIRMILEHKVITRKLVIR